MTTVFSPRHAACCCRPTPVGVKLRSAAKATVQQRLVRSTTRRSSNARHARDAGVRLGGTGSRRSSSSTGTSRRGRRRIAPNFSPKRSSSPARASCRCSSTRHGRGEVVSQAGRGEGLRVHGADDEGRAPRPRRAAGAAGHRQDARRGRRPRFGAMWGALGRRRGSRA